jgi:hypothetical protein
MHVCTYVQEWQGELTDLTLVLRESLLRTFFAEGVPVENSKGIDGRFTVRLDIGR